MGERVLATGELNRAVLARQLLLERAELPIVAALEQVAGLQTQYAPSGYIGLWSRLVEFERAALTRALEDRSVVQASVMRATIHMVAAGDYPLFTAGVRDARRTWWLRAAKGDEQAIVAAAARVRDALADGPRRRDELVTDLGLDGSTWSAVGLWLDLVRVPPAGTWDRRRADVYGLADDWLGPSTATYDEGLDRLLSRYLGAFGPAARKEIANWAGLPVTAIKPVLERLELRRLRDEEGTELLDLPGAPLPAAGTPAPVRFLPTWDATLLAHARRTRILPEEYRPRIFHNKMPQSIPTFLVDGQVAGTWVQSDGRIEVTPFAPLPAKVRRQVDAEAERLAAFMR